MFFDSHAALVIFNICAADIIQYMVNLHNIIFAIFWNLFIIIFYRFILFVNVWNWKAISLTGVLNKKHDIFTIIWYIFSVEKARK